MKQLCKQMAGAAAILFILAACSENNSNYPEEYVGFDKTTKNYSFDRSKDVEEFDIKIIAAEKKKEDREVLINGVSMPGQTVVFSIEDKKVIIPAKKKSANLHVKIYPKKTTDPNNLNLTFTIINNENESAKDAIFQIKKGFSVGSFFISPVFIEKKDEEHGTRF